MRESWYLTEKLKYWRTVSPVIAPYAPPILDIQLFLELISNTPAMTSAAPQS